MGNTTCCVKQPKAVPQQAAPTNTGGTSYSAQGLTSSEGSEASPTAGGWQRRKGGVRYHSHLMLESNSPASSLASPSELSECLSPSGCNGLFAPAIAGMRAALEASVARDIEVHRLNATKGTTHSRLDLWDAAAIAARRLTPGLMAEAVDASLGEVFLHDIWDHYSSGGAMSQQQWNSAVREVLKQVVYALPSVIRTAVRRMLRSMAAPGERDAAPDVSVVPRFELLEDAMVTAAVHGPFAGMMNDYAAAAKGNIAAAFEAFEGPLQQADFTEGFRLACVSPPEGAGRRRDVECGLTEVWTAEVAEHFAANAPDLPSPGRVGLENLGSTCAVSAAVHALSATPRIRAHLLVSPVGGSTGQGGKSEAVPAALTALMRRLWTFEHLRTPVKPGQRATEAPVELMRALAGGGGAAAAVHEMDVQEVLCALLDTVHEEEVGVAASASAASLVTRLFHGATRSAVECVGCHEASQVAEPFSILSVPIEDTRAAVGIGACLDACFAPDTVSRSCPSCGHADAVKRMRLSSLPQYLMVQVRRLRYNSSKVLTPLKVLRSLDMTPYCTPDVKVNGFDGGNAPKRYSLYAVLCHFSSRSGNGRGHYTAVTNAGGSSKWHLFDDTLVRPVQEEPPQKPYAAYYVVMYKLEDLRSPFQ